MAMDDCTLGVRNEQRIIALERDMGKVGKMLLWLCTSSFATLASVITGLVIILLK